MAARTNIPNVIHDLGLPRPPLPTPFAPPPSIPSQNLTQLANASENTVREILLALCQDSAQERKAMGYLRKLQRLESERLRNQGNDNNMDATREIVGITTATKGARTKEGLLQKSESARGVKGLSGKMRTIHKLANTTQVRLAHLSISLTLLRSLEENEDGPEWGEWDPDPDSDEAKEMYPEFYHWDCCDARGDDGDSGCTRGSHIALHKKPRPEASRS
ncbi:hypothetical protein NUW58_g8166 [Xylaria curta]|uniref:Uncharacterized protein n=1 Tax=Xylaria curta TaxID=42375 RepID=A0ACC1NA15_9PEZI|nr:hypothetical protein NUW58_g8166 [Xylaria curta]